jgi:hypothetical protein
MMPFLVSGILFAQEVDRRITAQNAAAREKNLFINQQSRLFVMVWYIQR